MAITVVSGGVQPSLDPLKDGDLVLSAYTAQAATLANWETSATGGTITDVVAEAFVNGSNSGIIAEEHSAFSPASLFASGEQGGWYDPSDLSTLFQDSAGTTAVTADGDSVGRMEDKSGNGNHATQSTSAARPVYRTDGTLHWLEFDGVDDFLRADSLASSGFSLIYAFEPSEAGSTSNDGIFGMGPSSPNRIVLYGNDAQGGTGGLRLFRDDPGNFMIEAGTDQQGVPQVITVRSRDQDHDFRRNSVQVLSRNETSNENPTTLTIGGAGDIGQLSSHKLFGAVFMLIKLDGSDLTDTESYFANLAGVTI